MSGLTAYAHARPIKSHLEIMEDFRYCDRDMDGRIDIGEFKEFMDSLDADFDDSELNVAFRAIDSNSDGLIDLYAFLEWWQSS